MTYSAEVLADSPVGYWRMADTVNSSGGSIVDSSGNSHTGVYTMFGASGINGPVTGLLVADTNQATDFPGSGIGIGQVAHGSWMDVTQFTAEAIVQPDSVSGGRQILVHDFTGSGSDLSFRLYIGSGSLGVLMRDTGGTLYSAGGGTVVAGRTYHCAASYDGTTLKVYLNGKLVGSTTVGATLLVSSQAFTFGALGNGTSEQFDGRIDEVAFYNTALSLSRLNAHYAASLGPYGKEVVADAPLFYYRLGEGGGTTAYDASGNGRDATYGNVPTLGATGALTAVSDNDTAVTFAGNQYVENSHISAYDVTSLTCEAWVKVASAPSGNKAIWGHITGTQSYVGWQLEIESGTGKPFWYMFNGAVVMGATGNATTNICNGNWHHVVATYDHANIKMYIDGALQSTTANTNTIPTPNDGIRLGADRTLNSGGGLNDQLTGSIDEAAFYDTVLSGTRIAAHYAAGTGVTTQSGAAALTATSTLTSGATRERVAAATLTATSTLTSGATLTPDAYSPVVLADSPVFYWKLDEATGSVATDSSGNGRDGTIIGTPTRDAALLPTSAIQSMLFDSTSRYIDLAPATYLQASSYSIECWVRPGNVTSYHALFNRDESSIRGWNVYIKDGKLNGYDGATDHISTGATLVIGTAYHVVATSDSSTVKLYVNGVLDFTFTAASGWFNNSTLSSNGFHVGTSLAGSFSRNFPTNGDISHVAYYNTQLSGTRVADHYSAGAGVTTQSAAVAMSATSTLTPAATRERVGAAALTATSTFTAAGAIPGTTQSGAVAFTSTSTLTTDAVRERPAAVAMSATSTLTSAGTATGGGGGGTTLDLSTAVFYYSGAGQYTGGTVTTNGSSTLEVGFPLPVLGAGQTIVFEITGTLPQDFTMYAVPDLAHPYDAGIDFVHNNTGGSTVISRTVEMTIGTGIEGYDTAVAGGEIHIFLSIGGSPTITGITYTVTGGGGGGGAVLVTGSAQSVAFSVSDGGSSGGGFPVLVGDLVVIAMDKILHRAPTSLAVSVYGADPNEDLTFYIDGVEVDTDNANGDGTLQQISIPVATAQGAAGSHVVSVVGTVHSGEDSFIIELDPITSPADQNVDTDPVLIPEAHINGVYKWVFQDLMPGGLGSWVMPINPSSMSSPGITKVMSVQHSTAAVSGQFHIWEAGATAIEWTFSGFCPDEAFYDQLRAYAAITRRFYVIDHRNRAWKVAINTVDMVLRKRALDDTGAPQDWRGDYTVHAYLYDQTPGVPV